MKFLVVHVSAHILFHYENEYHLWLNIMPEFMIKPKKFPREKYTLKPMKTCTAISAYIC